MEKLILNTRILFLPRWFICITPFISPKLILTNKRGGYAKVMVISYYRFPQSGFVQIALIIYIWTNSLRIYKYGTIQTSCNCSYVTLKVKYCIVKTKHKYMQTKLILDFSFPYLFTPFYRSKNGKSSTYSFIHYASQQVKWK